MDTIRQQLQEALDVAQDRLRNVRGASMHDGSAEMTAAPTWRGDEMDEAQANESREEIFAARQRLTEYVRRLVVALERLREGGYGVCVDCGEPIPAIRLRVMPDAETCVRCQDRIERLNVERADRLAAA